MLSLFNIPSNDPSKMTQRVSQSMCSSIHRKREILFLQVSTDTSKSILPIRPKPLLYPKDSTILTNSRHSSKADQTGCNILVSIVMSYVSFRFDSKYIRIYLSMICLLSRISMMRMRLKNLRH